MRTAAHMQAGACPCCPGYSQLWRLAEGSCALARGGSLTGAQGPQPRSRASGPDAPGERGFRMPGCRSCSQPPSSPEHAPTRFLLLLSEGHETAASRGQRKSHLQGVSS